MNTSETLIIEHGEHDAPAAHAHGPGGAAAGTPPRFWARRLSDGKTTAPVSIAPPQGYPVKDRGNSELMHELRWYLEHFLEYPFAPETDRAARVRDALAAWGTAAFEALFGDRTGGRLFDAATEADYGRLCLRIASDDPRILAWPWEALVDPQAGCLAHHCQIERRLNRARDPAPVPAGLATDRVRILLVTARPYAGDVHYRSVSRPLVELVQREGLPAEITVLRPPTLANLRRHLHERPGHYHLLHFDGHGAYGVRPEDAPPPIYEGGGHKLAGPQGYLVFEDDQGEADLQPAATLSSLLREHHVPAVVLNACQSATISPEADHAFASVATALIQAGIRNVVAMSYSLYVSGAQQFLPAFYRRLFESGSFAAATRAGRQQMRETPGRVCARGTYVLEDWLVPVLYQQDPFDFRFARAAAAAAVTATAPRRMPDGTFDMPMAGGASFLPGQPAGELAGELPRELNDAENPHGFIGRDGAMLSLERALHRAPAGLLITGIGGVGKTTLARGFVRWLVETSGVARAHVFWFRFDESLRSAEHVLNRMGEALFGTPFVAAPLDQRVEALARVMRAQRFLIVWDNFEVARGIPDTSVHATLRKGDRALLRRFLAALRGGKTKVLITSRSEEEWLGAEDRCRIGLSGLQGEERWEHCDTVLRDLGLCIDREDPALASLLDMLDGHPLAMRVLLPELEKRLAPALVSALQSSLDTLAPAAAAGSEAATEARLFATLRFVEDGLPDELRPLLVPLSLHERFVDADCLEVMARQVDAAWTRDVIDRFLTTLGKAGLVQERGQALYELHPLLGRFLRSRLQRGAPGNPVRPADHQIAWRRAFVDVMGNLADSLAPRELHEQRVPFLLHGGSFHLALAEAEVLGMDMHEAMLMQSLGAYALNIRDFATAASLFERLAAHLRQHGNVRGEASACYQLGRIAQEQREFVAADAWCRKALTIAEQHGDEHRVAITYHLLGTIAQQQREFAAAETWYRKSLAIFMKLCDEHHAAGTYRNLGIIAQQQREFAAAETWYHRALAIEEKHGDEHGAAMTYHQLGRIAEEQREFAVAETWYRKSLAIEEKHGDEHGAAITYHNLGVVAQEQRDFAAAETWYRKSLTIKEKHGDEHDAAITYHNLGIIAQEQCDFAATETWYSKSLTIKEKHGDEHGAAQIYHQLGILAGLQQQYEKAGTLLLHSILSFSRTGDTALMQRGADNFLFLNNQAPPAEKPKLAAMWQQAGLPPLPDPEAG